MFWAFQFHVSHFAFIMMLQIGRFWPAPVKEPSLTFNKTNSESVAILYSSEGITLNSCFLLYDCLSQDETEFRDKLSPININLNYSLDESHFEDGLTVKPILNYYQKSSVTEQV